MARLFSTGLVVALFAIVSIGCTSSTDPATSNTGSQSEAAVGKLCGDCGESKGSESCCSDTAEKCECGMNKGSKLCCVELDADSMGKDLCGDCGHVAGSDSCCADDAEKCACGMAKGSPLCCKLKTDDAAASE